MNLSIRAQTPESGLRDWLHHLTTSFTLYPVNLLASAALSRCLCLVCSLCFPLLLPASGVATNKDHTEILLQTE